MNPDRIRAWLGENRIRAAAVFLAALLLLLLLIGLLLVNVWIGRIRYERDNAEAVTIDRAYAAGNGIYFPDIEPIQKSGVVNVLFLGTDFAIGADGSRGRADSNMLCSLNTRSGEIKLVSFERGIGVPVPGHGSDLLTHAYQWGGPELSKSIISQMGSDGFLRIKIGVGGDAPSGDELVDFVLGKPSKEDMEAVRKRYPDIEGAVDLMIDGDFILAQSKYNGKGK